MILTESLSYKYTGGKPIIFPDINCDSGDSVLLLGKSGVGKSTLLHLLGGILHLQKGNITIGGIDMSTLTGEKMDVFRGQNIGMVFQQNHFVSALNVIDNLLLAQYLAGKNQDPKKAYELLENLNIDSKSKSKIHQLSQGEKQRVGIARALINNPKLLLADEPTSALDDINCLEVVKLLKNQAKSHGSALIIVTHDTRLKESFNNQIDLN